MPTVIIGNNTGDDYSGTEDAGIWYEDDNNFGGRSYAEIKNTGAINSMLIGFSGLSSIPAASNVSAASMFLYGSNFWDTIVYHIRRLLVLWTEGTQDNGDRTLDTPHSCSWYHRTEDTDWGTAGARGDGTDRNAAASGTVTLNDTAAYRESDDLSTDVDSMVKTPANNFGWVITRDTLDAFYFSQVQTKESADGQRPYLSVTYASAGNSAYYRMNQ